MQELLYKKVNHPYSGVRQMPKQELHQTSAEVIPVHQSVPLTKACRESIVPRRKQTVAQQNERRSCSEVVATGKTHRLSVWQRKQIMVSHNNSANPSKNRCVLQQLQGWEQSESKRYSILWRRCNSIALQEEWTVYLHFGETKLPSAVMSLRIILDLAASSQFSAFSRCSLFSEG